MSRRVSAAISVPIVVASFAIGTIAGIHTEDPDPSAEPREASAGTPPKSAAAERPPEKHAPLEAAHTVPDPLFPVVIPAMVVALPLGPPAELGVDARRTPPAVAQQPRYAARYYMAPRRKAKAQGQVVETVPILGPLVSMFK